MTQGLNGHWWRQTKLVMIKLVAASLTVPSGFSQGEYGEGRGIALLSRLIAKASFQGSRVINNPCGQEGFWCHLRLSDRRAAELRRRPQL